MICASRYSEHGPPGLSIDLEIYFVSLLAKILLVLSIARYQTKT